MRRPLTDFTKIKKININRCGLEISIAAKTANVLRICEKVVERSPNTYFLARAKSCFKQLQMTTSDYK